MARDSWPGSLSGVIRSALSGNIGSFPRCRRGTANRCVAVGFCFSTAALMLHQRIQRAIILSAMKRSCPHCRSVTGREVQFCEACGFKFSEQPPVTGRMLLVLTAVIVVGLRAALMIGLQRC